MENRKVIKIGGSNLKQVNDIKKITDIIINYDKAPIVVVSAFYGITDKLLSGIEKSVQNPEEKSKLINEISQLKFEYILELIDNEDIRNTTYHRVEALLKELSGLFDEAIQAGQVSLQLKDLILSYGERLSAVMIWGAVCSKNNKCIVDFPENIGFITDDIYGNASVDLRLSKQNLNSHFEQETIYIIPGFYGVTKNQQVRLLGRGGTDYSAAAIAYCIDASALDIWKDVDGFMTGDPKHVENPVQISHLSYLEAAELSYFGAGILHPRTVEPLSLKNIPIRLFNINKDNAKSKAQTVIDEKESIFPKVIKSLTFENRIGILKIKGPGVGFIPGILSDVSKVLSDHNINISSVITSQISINLLIKTDEIEKARSLINSLEIHAINEISVNNDVSLIAVVGNGMTQSPGIAAKVFTAIAQEGINILLSSSGASEVVTYFIVNKNDREKAIAKLHEALFEDRLINA